MSQRTYAVLGSEFHLPVVKVPKHKDAPAVTEHRLSAVADAIGPARREEIRVEAIAYAAQRMREFERKERKSEAEVTA